MRIAISAETNEGLDSIVSHHFGRCPYFVLIDVEDHAIQSFQVVENPHYIHHQPGLVPDFIHNQEVDVMISGGMGRRAIVHFQDFGIQTATGGSGTAKEALERFLRGELPTAEPCREGGRHRHEQGHHHGGCDKSHKGGIPEP